MPADRRTEHASDQAGEQPGQSSLRSAVFLLGALLVGLGVRLYQLGFDSLWYDETVSASLAKRLPTEIIRHTAGDIHPPGYYLVLHGWQLLFEPLTSPNLEFLLAYSSVIWGMITLALLYPLGRKLFGQKVAVLAVWFAAINPFHAWYSQEVRMYTMGSALGLLCLWAALSWLDDRPGRRARTRWAWLTTYVVAAVLGLYTLYYFGLLLIAINVIVFLSLYGKHKTAIGQGTSTLRWLVAQIAVLLLYSPWLPILWRQAMEPPVPPWRMPWSTPSDFMATVTESLAALFVGQTPPVSITWPWALLSLAAVATFALLPLERMTSSKRASLMAPRSTVLLVVFLPILLLYLMTATITPLYHVRYLSTYAAPYMLILAATVVGLASYRRWLGVIGATVIVLVSFGGLQQYWQNPAYDADDHRRAVSELADNWRPGDLIFVNAGWAYTILDVYWPTVLQGADDSLPPPLAEIVRFHELAGTVVSGPIVARSGSIDGDDSLGWGDSASDFFAISSEDAVGAMDVIANTYQRVWHYRIYDTVSDPEGVIRTYLESEGSRRSEVPYPGRDYLLVESYAMNKTMSPTSPIDGSTVDFGDAIRLEQANFPSRQSTGNRLYVELHWLALEGLANQPNDLSMSMRIYADQDTLLAQSDQRPYPPTSQWVEGDRVGNVMALDIPANAQPGSYSVELIVYQPNDGSVLAPPDDHATIYGQRRQLGTVELSD